jgi:hypothetical protein
MSALVGESYATNTSLLILSIGVYVETKPFFAIETKPSLN